MQSRRSARSPISIRRSAPVPTAQVIDTYRIAKDFKKRSRRRTPLPRSIPEDRKSCCRFAPRSWRKSARADDAAAELKKLLDGKNDRETYISLAQIYEKGKNYTEMAKAVDAADKLSDSKEEKESIAFMRGAMYEKMKKFDAAETRVPQSSGTESEERFRAQLSGLHARRPQCAA